MAFRTENNVASQLIAALAGAVSTDSMTLLYGRRQITDLNANSGEIELKQSGETRIAGIVSSGNGTSFYGHTPVGTTWAARSTGTVESTVGAWTWRALIGAPAGMGFFESPDDADAGWSEFPASPLEHTAFAIASLVLGSNGREVGPFDFAAIRVWDRPRDLTALLAERLSEWALSDTGLVLDKRGTGADLGTALAAGTGTLTTGGTVVLNADLPATIGSAPVPSSVIRPALNAGYSTLSGYLQ